MLFQEDRLQSVIINFRTLGDFLNKGTFRKTSSCGEFVNAEIKRLALPSFMLLAARHGIFHVMIVLSKKKSIHPSPFHKVTLDLNFILQYHVFEEFATVQENS